MSVCWVCADCVVLSVCVESVKMRDLINKVVWETSQGA